jgi:CRISPR system Cascade subunit CasC
MILTKETEMTARYIDIHVLQSVPPSNINRDDTGSPKTAMFGGRRRARVSSQAWKRQTRATFNGWLDPSQVGTRTKDVVRALAEEIIQRDPELAAEADGIAETVLNKAGIKTAVPKVKKGEEPGPAQSGYLLFLSAGQVSTLAQAGITGHRGGDLAGHLASIKVKDLADSNHSVDCALFGRMVADAPDLNVDAACQVAHAIGVHAADTEFDYFTAVDDRQGDDTSGAGMIGTVEFISTTLYRYATISLSQLATNLGNETATRQAVQVFIDAFVQSMPTGKQNTFANRTLPDAVVISLRADQPINCVGAFERAVVPGPGESGYVAAAARALADHLGALDEGWGSSAEAAFVSRIGPAAAALDGVGERVAMKDLGRRVAEAVSGSRVSA